MTIAEDIAGSAPAVPRLAFIHTTTAATFRQICAAGKLDPHLCPVMRHELIYLFYGRAAFRPGPIEPTNMDRDSRPVCLLFDADRLPAPFAIYPCDTGAHQRGLYSPQLDGIKFPELECASISLAPQKIVARYFGENDEYFYGAAIEALVPPPISPVAQAFHSLLTFSGPRKHDDRCLTVEYYSTRKFRCLARWTLSFCRTSSVRTRKYMHKSVTLRSVWCEGANLSTANHLKCSPNRRAPVRCCPGTTGGMTMPYEVPFRLTGHVNPRGALPAICVPTFSNKIDNYQYVQVIGIDHKIMSMDIFDPESVGKQWWCAC